ncbi:hypothetical protein GOP47_0012967 [Adiantum capillus-veneris]|uniref:Uncharacterized protein n=1 Tax=Adiantum capillus-veneris TaxID=13818 RepID=A0A9D4URW2_ADICA|nr:hypothetical protein GOP47_0012967 [Adiantum capillus-veneris]
MPRKSEERAAWKKNAELPWRQKAPQREAFEHAKLRASNEPGQGPTMYLPQEGRRETYRDQMRGGHPRESFEVDPRLKYTFRKNFQFLKKVFTVDTMLMPLPTELSRNVARNLGFFTRIFTQFFDPKGIQDAQKSMGIGRESRIRHVR